MKKILFVLLASVLLFGCVGTPHDLIRNIMQALGTRK